MVLYIESTLDQYGLDLSKMGLLLCSGTELHVTKAVYYRDLFIEHLLAQDIKIAQTDIK